MTAIGPGTRRSTKLAANVHGAGKIAAEFGLTRGEYQFQHPVLSTLDKVRDLIKRAAEQSVGLLLDAYHLQRGSRPGAGFSEVPSGEVFYVQFSDVPDAPPNGPPPTDRLPPGKGLVRWSELFRLLAAKNYTGYLSYEAPNSAQWERPAADVAREGAHATRHALARAFSP
jgi:sugar phosphate isomerase/epimerase